MRLKLLAIVGLLVVAGSAVVASLGGFTPAPAAATNLLTAAAEVTNVTDEIAATGTVQPASQFALFFGQDPVASDPSDDQSPPQADGLAGSVTWPVTDLKVAVGDRVTKGQVLATAGTTDLEAKIDDATRAAKSAAIQLKQATEDRADAATTAAKRQTQMALYNAQGQDTKAKADLVALVALRDNVSLVARTDGVVTAVALTAGSNAPSGVAITMISSDLQVVTSVVESDVAAIAVGQAATVSVAALDASLRGSVTSIDPVGTGSGSGGVVSFAVNITLASPPAGLRPGMSADITIVAASRQNVLAVPSRALSGIAGAYTVRVVAADGTVSARNVEVGLVTSSLAEITSGLQAGEKVVTGTSSSQSGLGGNVQTIGGGPFPGGGVIRGETKP
jgi:macrolide-specific efflux system membrane fusion protein